MRTREIKAVERISAGWDNRNDILLVYVRPNQQNKPIGIPSGDTVRCERGICNSEHKGKESLEDDFSSKEF